MPVSLSVLCRDFSGPFQILIWSPASYSQGKKHLVDQNQFFDRLQMQLQQSSVTSKLHHFFGIFLLLSKNSSIVVKLSGININGRRAFGSKNGETTNTILKSMYNSTKLLCNATVILPLPSLP